MMPGNIVRETVNEAASAKDAAKASPVLFQCRRPLSTVQLSTKTIAQIGKEVKTNRGHPYDLWKFHSGAAEKGEIICMIISCLFPKKMLA